MFGRSNSLSLNTGAANNMFSQQNNQSSQAPPAGGLFGSSTQTSQAGGGLFGSNSNTQTSQPSGGLFGSSTQTSQAVGGLFGSGNTTSQAPQGTGLFGSSTTQQTNAGNTGGSLFGGSLFGNTQNNNTTNATTGGTSLFGNTTAQQQQPAMGTSSIFNRTTTNQQPQQPSIFGLSASQPTYTQPSLLGASQYRAAGSRTTPFAGKLSMGQSAAPQQPTPAGTGTRYSFDTMKSTTRFAELADDVQAQLEAIDKMIQMQEKFCRDIEGFVPKHGDDVEGLGRDVEFIREKVEAAEQSLGIDAQGVQAQQKVLTSDQTDFGRCERVTANLWQPQQYHYNNLVYGGGSGGRADGDASGSRDMDLTGNYFAPLAAELKQTLDTYAENLSEIEAHMRVVEQSTQMQAQQVAARRAGVGSGGNGGAGGRQEETVRELAETLRGFEGSILNAAGLVGQCREGVNDVVLGRVGARGLGSSGRW